ncbi:MAG: hypothetical protein EPN91_08145 [Salinibacterium sp.]|nr:MAG: hypothetical protein EPN91_08145 [Salinibacterium sp.]
MPEQPRAHQLPAGHYPPTTRGLAKYLQETQGLEREHAVRIVRATFEFIKLCVLEHGLEFVIYKFGKFSRRLRRSVDHPVLSGPTRAQFVIKFTASQNYGRVRLEEN